VARRARAAVTRAAGSRSAGGARGAGIGSPLGRPEERRSYAWVQGLLCGVAATLVPGPALLAGLLLAPGLVSLLLDQAPGKPMARAVLLCGLAAAAPPLAALWHSGAGVGAAIALAGEPAVLGTAWLAGAGGWLLNEFAPLLLRLGMDGLAAAQAGRLKAERARLAEAWDLGPQGGPQGAAAGGSTAAPPGAPDERETD
jgi:hypothetical protein